MRVRALDAARGSASVAPPSTVAGDGQATEADVPGAITHGADLPATSGAAEAVIGAQGSLTEWTGSTTLSGTQVIENRSFTSKQLSLAAGAHITLKNCRIVSPTGTTGQMIKMTAGGGQSLEMIDCTLVCRASSGGGNCITGYGSASLHLLRCVVRGGIDGIHFHGNGPAVWETGDPLVPVATFLMEDSWIGDNERWNDSHSDLFQMAGQRPNRIKNFLFRRCRFMAYSLPVGSDTLTTRADPAAAQMGSACFIDTTGSASTGIGATYYALRKCYFEGGNNMVAGGEGAAHNELTDNLFGPRARFAAISAGWQVVTNNRWAASGTLDNGVPCVKGELV